MRLRRFLERIGLIRVEVVYVPRVATRMESRANYEYLVAESRERAADAYVADWKARIEREYAQNLKQVREFDEIQRGVDRIYEDFRAEADAAQYVSRELAAL